MRKSYCILISKQKLWLTSVLEPDAAYLAPAAIGSNAFGYCSWSSNQQNGQIDIGLLAIGVERVGMSEK